MAFLLDTCAAIWLAEGEGLSLSAQKALKASLDGGEEVHLSPITAWEVGQLNAKGRLSLRMPPLAWFQRLAAPDGMHLTGLDPEILVGASFLPGDPPKDPADRIIVATARQRNLTVVTRDRLLLAYAEAGHLSALTC